MCNVYVKYNPIKQLILNVEDFNIILLDLIEVKLVLCSVWLNRIFQNTCGEMDERSCLSASGKHISSYTSQFHNRSERYGTFTF